MANGDTPRAVVNIDDLALETTTKGGKFAVTTGEIGEALGLSVLGAMLHIVPPGKSAFPFHRHHVSDEMFLILDGEGTYRTDAGDLPIKSGDCLGAPAGGIAHQILNTGENALKYIGFSNNTNAEVVEYPDSGNLLVAAGPKGIWYGDSTYKTRTSVRERGYWDGEDTGDNE